MQRQFHGARVSVRRCGVWRGRVYRASRATEGLALDPGDWRHGVRMSHGRHPDGGTDEAATGYLAKERSHGGAGLAHSGQVSRSLSKAIP